MKVRDLLAPIDRFRAYHEAGPIQATFDPRKPGVTRIHLIPLKTSLRERNPSMVFINGWHMFLIGPSWADLLHTFIEVLYEKAEPGKRVSPSELDVILSAVMQRMHNLYPSIPSEILLDDLNDIVALCIAVAHDTDVPPELKAPISFEVLTKNLKAPHRMDLLVTPMIEDGKWICPLHCKGCYATTQPAMRIEKSLSTAEWKTIIDKCREAGISQLTFTGGEPTEREDLVELINHARWHITRLNTNGFNITAAYAKKLFDADLDGIQVTLYSHDAEVHDELVGRKGAWVKTTQAIKNSLKAGLSVSVNTPLVNRNADYDQTLEFIHGLGVKYATCSGLIPAGAARGQIKSGVTLTNAKLMAVMDKAVKKAKALGMELSFTSPGWLSEEQIKMLGLSQPICGACLTNMAVMPNGAVAPCQSWLADPQGLGNLLTTPWKKIWNHAQCKRMRSMNQEGCPLKETLAEGGE